MKRSAQPDAKLRHEVTLEETTSLELLRTTDLLTRKLVPVLKAEDLSSTQYNVLRILRGSPDGLPCGAIGCRMITRDPDITRLLDRMEKRGLITRYRDTEDRRVVMARITPEGLKVVARLDGPVEDAHRKLLGHLGKTRLKQLCELLKAARKEDLSKSLAFGSARQDQSRRVDNKGFN